jgi:hypothetical protein
MTASATFFGAYQDKQNVYSTRQILHFLSQEISIRFQSVAFQLFIPDYITTASQ